MVNGQSDHPVKINCVNQANSYRYNPGILRSIVSP